MQCDKGIMLAQGGLSVNAEGKCRVNTESVYFDPVEVLQSTAVWRGV